jgi:hypothetical protein
VSRRVFFVSIDAVATVTVPLTWPSGETVPIPLTSRKTPLTGARPHMALLFSRMLGLRGSSAHSLVASENPAPGNLGFRVCSERLESVPETFDMIIDRQAPFDLSAVAAHLKPGGYFITQQVGERNMACVKAALGQPVSQPAIQRQAIAASRLRPLAFMEYDVEYVVRDIESLVFWLNALDADHADVDGRSALASAAILNRVLAGNVDERGFVTNEHRYLAVAQRVRKRTPGPPGIG